MGCDLSERAGTTLWQHRVVSRDCPQVAAQGSVPGLCCVYNHRLWLHQGEYVSQRGILCVPS